MFRNLINKKICFYPSRLPFNRFLNVRNILIILLILCLVLIFRIWGERVFDSRR